MKFERLLLIPFFGNFIINNIVVALAVQLPASTPDATTVPTFWQTIQTPQYIGYVVFAAITVALFAWWYLARMTASAASGAIFGVAGFIIWIATALVTGVAGAFIQGATAEQVGGLLTNFGSFLIQPQTIMTLVFWIVPATAVGYFLGKKAAPMM